MNANLKNSFDVMDNFTETFVNFWTHVSKAQALNQQLGYLAEQIRLASGEDRAELETRREMIEENYKSETHLVFPLMKELASRDDEIAIESYETLRSANMTVSINFARLAFANPTIKDIFLGQTMTEEV